ncbi:uncharacterized protein LY79DRAFT_401845 [Colletotrichum navitas]|uniref:Uncharacterized protein n=1 Tax=Colletotrichum navitas TaxID=681940 RepID=A0AAD8UZV7_9PEZI|nr:uncharacterized protein LY79DRAFT_401845 [Colletotrichum navitas]KAK1573613.1 hypothetical protein LY79DRAFT_401845 [Colletotrichum navitas]
MTPNGGPCTPRSTRSYQLRHVLRTEAERPWELIRASLLFLSFLHWGHVEHPSVGELTLRSERTGPRQSAETRRSRGYSLKGRYESDDTLAWPCHSIQNRTTFRGSQPRLVPLIHASVVLFTAAQNVSFPFSSFFFYRWTEETAWPTVAGTPRPRRAATQSLGQTCHQKKPK